MKLETFKELIRQKIKENETIDEESLEEWKKIEEKQEEFPVGFYEPTHILTLKGYVKTCPNDNTKLDKKFIGKKYGIYGLHEYYILKCDKCGYEYAYREST